MTVKDYINELKSLASEGIYSIAKIEWWLLKYLDEYNRLQEEESKRFMYFIDGKWIRLPDYFDARTASEKFLKTYDILNKFTDLHKDENYFKQEIVIYHTLKNKPKKLKDWLVKNERFGAEKYFMFTLDNDSGICFDSDDFKYTIQFKKIFDRIYWEFLEESGLEKLN